MACAGTAERLPAPKRDIHNQGGTVPNTTATQFTVSLPNKPGQLAELTQYFADKGINISAIAVEALGDVSFVRLTVSEKESEVKSWLETKGYKATATKVFQVQIQNQPGQLHQLASKLAKQNVNIENLYGSTWANNQPATLYVAVDQFEKAENLLSQELAASRN